MSTKRFFETPDFLATRVFLHEPDQTKEIERAGKRVKVGNDKYKVEGYFDPTTPKAREFIGALISYLTDDVGLPSETAREIVGLRLRTRKSVTEAAMRKAKGGPLSAAMTKLAEAVPETWRQIGAATAYGPVSIANERGTQVSKAEVFAGCTLAASVSPNVYQSELHDGADRLSFWLGPVFFVKTGPRLFGGGPDARLTFASRIHGGVSDRNVADGLEDIHI